MALNERRYIGVCIRRRCTENCERRYIFLSHGGPIKTGAGEHVPAPQLVKKVPSGFFAKLLPELQNKFLCFYFAILPLRRVIKRERKP